MSKNKYKKKEVKRVPFELPFDPSPEQVGIRDQWLETKDNIFIEAVAGSGKSSTIAYVMSQDPGIEGAYIAFNRDIVTDMEPKCPEGIEVKTRHSFGYGAIARETGKRLFVDKNKIIDVLKGFGYDMNDKNDEGSFDRVKSMQTCIDQLRNNLVNPDDQEGIENVLFLYNIDIDVIGEFMGKLPEIFNKIVELGHEGVVDFVDMKWLPVYCDWKMRKVPSLFLDEYQDSSALDMEFDRRISSGRVVITGDSRQSIYHFAGAMSNSIEQARGYHEFVDHQLYTSFRCSKAVTERAQRIVPHFSCPDWARDGLVEQKEMAEVDFSKVDPQSMFLCRRNAPLIGPCFRAIKQGVKANIKGREIGEQLARLVLKIKGKGEPAMPKFLDKLDSYIEREKEKVLNRKRVNYSVIENLQDQQAIIESFSENCDSVDDMVRKIRDIFKDSVPGLLFSSVHKSKGLEAETVHIIDSPHIRISNENMTAEAKIQEANLEYVAYTRAKNELYLLT